MQTFNTNKAAGLDGDCVLVVFSFLRCGVRAGMDKRCRLRLHCVSGELADETPARQA